jgi:flavin-dependent dehydrogenase
LIGPADCAPFSGVRFIAQDGAVAEARFRGTGGLGVRRTALCLALKRRALDEGVVLCERCAVRGYASDSEWLEVTTDRGDVRARMLVAADGLASTLRAVAGLESGARGPRRFGLRQHFKLPPWSEFVEVHLRDGIEAYVTPAGSDRVGVAFLWDDARKPCPASMTDFMRQFPSLGERISGTPADSEPRGSGPMAQAARARVANRFALVGDAAGYVDAITGEGLSLALAAGRLLGRMLPDVIASGARRESLVAYERAAARQYARYALVTRSMLAMTRSSRARRLGVGLLARFPRLFDGLLNWAVAHPA